MLPLLVHELSNGVLHAAATVYACGLVQRIDDDQSGTVRGREILGQGLHHNAVEQRRRVLGHLFFQIQGLQAAVILGQVRGHLEGDGQDGAGGAGLVVVAVHAEVVRDHLAAPVTEVGGDGALANAWPSGQPQHARASRRRQPRIHVGKQPQPPGEAGDVALHLAGKVQGAQQALQPCLAAAEIQLFLLDGAHQAVEAHSVPFLALGGRHGVGQVQVLDAADAGRRPILQGDQQDRDDVFLQRHGFGDFVQAIPVLAGRITALAPPDRMRGHQQNHQVAIVQPLLDERLPVASGAQLVIVEPNLVPARLQIVLDAPGIRRVLVVPVGKEDLQRPRRAAGGLQRRGRRGPGVIAPQTKPLAPLLAVVDVALSAIRTGWHFLRRPRPVALRRRRHHAMIDGRGCG